MNRFRVLAAGVAATLACSALAAEKEKPAERPLREVLESLLPGMGAENIPDRAKPQQEWQRLCYAAGAPGNEAQRAEACQAMIAKLGPEVPAAARIWLLKQLEIIGRGECLEAVARLVDDADPHLRDAAIRCLANNSDAGATKTLAAKLDAAGDNALKLALLNALAYRRDAAATAAVAKELGNPDAPTAAAAARALGRIATPDAAKALAAARPKATSDLRFRICDGLRACADALLAAGKPDEAMAIYTQLNSKDESRAVRLGALQGILNASGDKAAEKVLEFLAGDDADARAVAAGHVAALSGEALKTLAAGLPGLPQAGKMLLLDALAAKRDRAALPAAVEAAKSADEPLKLAGLRALGSLGDAAAVPLLIEAAFAGGPAGDAARRSLAAVHAEGVDAKLVAAMQAEQDARRRADLIGIIEARGAVAAVPALLQEALAADAGVRSRAMAALGRLAEPKDVAAMLKGLLEAQKGRERDEAEKAIVRVCQKAPDKEAQAEPVLAALAGASEAQKAIILPLLGRLGGAKAMELVKGALGSANAETREAAARALCNWPDASAAEMLLGIFQTSKETPQRVAALQALVRVTTPEDRSREVKLPVLEKALPAVRAALGEANAAVREAAVRALVDWPASDAAPDLLGLAKEAPEANFRILALRGHIRIAGLVARTSAEGGLKMYREAMGLATRPDERRQVLSGLGEMRAAEALDLVAPCLDDTEVAGEAASAAVAIAERLRDSHPKEAKAAMQKVLAVSKDRRVVRRAEDVIRHIEAKTAK